MGCCTFCPFAAPLFASHPHTGITRFACARRMTAKTDKKEEKVEKRRRIS